MKEESERSAIKRLEIEIEIRMEILKQIEKQASLSGCSTTLE